MVPKYVIKTQNIFRDEYRQSLLDKITINIQYI